MSYNDQPALKIDSLLVHGGGRKPTAPSAGVSTVPPIYASTTYLHESAEALDDAFEYGNDGSAFVYARQGNLSSHAFESAVALIEGGLGAVSFGSGMAAIHAALASTGLVSGVKILVSQDLYGPTIGLLRRFFIPLGVEVVFHDLSLPDAAERIREEEPDVVYAETLSNPLLKLVDIDAISAAAREVGATTIVDSTFTPPYLLRPLEHGFDLVVHSATKYISGHGDSTGGVVISSKRVLLDEVRANAALFGAMLSPFESHLLMRGLRTLAVRMERHCANALQVAHFLQEHPAVARVFYPGLPGHPQHEVAQRLFRPGQYGGLLSFELKECSRENAFRFMNRLQLCLPATTLGDVFSQVSYPALSSHRTLTDAERSKMGITAGCIRMSVGIEDAGDIINDVKQALEG